MNDRLPSLDERQSAMLAEMGIALWWQHKAPVVPEAVPAGAAPNMRAANTRPPLAAAPATDPAPQAQTAPARPPMPNSPAQRPVAVPVVVHEAPQGADLSGMGWDTLEDAIRSCTQCDLSRRRQQAVPGMGDRSPDWLIVGEAPGEEEDRQGLPFVGRAGQLLDRMLAAMGLTREQKVYIANVIKCRPPQNRNPDPVEIAQCTPYLLRQVELLQPKVILAMGRFAAHTVLAQGGAFDAEALRQMPLGKLRGQVHQVTLAGQRLPVVVTYHPAYLLRSPGEKAKTWADLCLAMDTMDRLHPGRSQL
ncbi:uracil-DNA glycosylase [Hydrogenophaga aquatica]